MNVAAVARYRRENSKDDDPILNFIYGQVLLDLAKCREDIGKGRSGLTRLYFREVRGLYHKIVRGGRVLMVLEEFLRMMQY